MIKPLQPPFGRWKCTPIPAYGGTSPGGGSFGGAMLLSYVAHCLAPIVPPSGVAKELDL